MQNDKKCPLLLIILFVILIIQLYLAYTQKKIQFKYVVIEEYDFNKLTGIYSKINNYKSDGYISISESQMNIGENEKMPAKNFNIISQHRDNSLIWTYLYSIDIIY